MFQIVGVLSFHSIMGRQTLRFVTCGLVQIRAVAATPYSVSQLNAIHMKHLLCGAHTMLQVRQEAFISFSINSTSLSDPPQLCLVSAFLKA